MRKHIKILMVVSLFISCQKEDIKKEVKTSKFNLTSDYINFKEKMTELDTLEIKFDHSICTYEGYEKIIITKQLDSLHITCNYKDVTFDTKPKWKQIYNLKIHEKDTIWKFEEFLERNKNRITTDKKKLCVLLLKSKRDKLIYTTKGLVDLNYFFADYFQTMLELHPENKNSIYGVEILE